MSKGNDGIIIIPIIQISAGCLAVKSPKPISTVKGAIDISRLDDFPLEVSVYAEVFIAPITEKHWRCNGARVRYRRLYISATDRHF